MTRSDDLRRADIVEACAALARVVEVRQAGSLDEDILVRAAERLLEIIGEAATRCSAELQSRHPEVDWRGLSGLRVVLAHHYHRTQPELIWRFAEVDSLVLRRALEFQGQPDNS